MYGGDEGEATGEDLELERYGLAEGQYSGSGESDTEEALYRQVHYNIGNDQNIQSVTEADTTIATSEDPLPHSGGESLNANLGKDNNDETSIDISDAEAASDDDCRDWKRVESSSKYSVSLKTTSKAGIADISHRGKRKRKAVVLVSDSAESDIIFLESKPKNQETLKKEGNGNLDVKTENQDDKLRETLPKKAQGNPQKRSWKKMLDNDATKVTKIDRTSWSSAHEGPEGLVGMSETSKVVIIADDSSSSSVLCLESGRSEEDASQPKSRPVKDGSEFFLDNKGMALKDVQRDKVSAEQGWKAERMKTKAMLKEGVDVINISSGDEDCMVIESCSEEEGLHVHFDENGERISPETSASSVKNSGKNKGKRKGGETVAPGRYFVQSRQKHIRCHNCNEMGHLKSECPKPPHVPACVLCGKRGHTDRYCPDALCFNCSLPGHQSRSCPIKRHIRYAKCTRCQMNGHLRKMCPDIWRQYHLTTEHGPIIKPNNTHHRSRRSDVYCSNCSRKGHRYYDCRSERFDEFVVFTYDKVCVYDRKHIGKMVFPAENKNADYLKLCRERGVPTLSTKARGDEPISIVDEDRMPPIKKRKSSLGIDERGDDHPRESISKKELTRKESRSWKKPQNVLKFGDEIAKGRNKDRIQIEPTDLPEVISAKLGLPGSVPDSKGDDVSMRKSITEQQLTKKKRKFSLEANSVLKSGSKKAKVSVSYKSRTLTEPTDVPKSFSSENTSAGSVTEENRDVSMKLSITDQQLTKKKKKSRTKLKNLSKSGAKKAKVNNENKTSSISSETLVTVSLQKDKRDYKSSKTKDAKRTTRKNVGKNCQKTKCDGKEVKTNEKERTSMGINNVQKFEDTKNNPNNRSREETSVILMCKDEKTKRKKKEKKKKSRAQTEQSDAEQFRAKMSQPSSKQQSDVTPLSKSARRRKRRNEAIRDLSDKDLQSLCPYEVENDILQASRIRLRAKKALKPINLSISVLKQKTKKDKGHEPLDVQEHRTDLEKAKRSANLAFMAARNQLYEAKNRKREFIKAGVSHVLFHQAKQKMASALKKAKH